MSSYQEYEECVLVKQLGYPDVIITMIEWLRDCWFADERSVRLFAREAYATLDDIPDDVRPFRLMTLALAVTHIVTSRDMQEEFRPEDSELLLKVLRNEVLE